jgi:putative spermidine/putrescine transport system ATP-binding protein
MLDEPLGSLDRVLRDDLAAELRAVLGELGLAAVHVTHDQEEAYAVADRIVVMRAGAVVRDGPAAVVWGDPASAFVARFLGHANVLGPAEAAALGLDAVPPVVVAEAALSLGARGRPARVVDVRFRGATSRVVLDVGGVTLSLHTSAPPPVGAEVALAIDPAHVHPLAPD